ncbi:MAG: hypothetical protein D6707_01745 [Bacteroidetes bacterium]|nr:MAG: hypothetical protein D6707_01745 [Bacteroidota bacterium]
MNNLSAFISLAWPQTEVKQVGVWYDKPMRWIGINKEGKYRVGHAACLLVDAESKKIHYFDFGRYHTPKKHGRVRSIETDPELQFPFEAEYNKGKITNLAQILQHIAGCKSTHGKGVMYAGVYYGADALKVKQKALEWQKKDAVPYGPFDKKGTNCSRFVASLAKAGISETNIQIKLWLPYTISPTPMYNIYHINNIGGYFEVKQSKVHFIPHKRNLKKYRYAFGG